MLAVHNSRVVLAIHGNPPPRAIAELKQRRMVTGERDRVAFIAAMGISRELNDLIRTVKFENLHLLTRDELYRFGIDTRAVAETAWRLETGARPFVSKIAVMRNENGSSFRTMEWRMYCEAGNRVPLMFAGEVDEASAVKSAILVTADADASKAAGGSPVRAGKYEMWSGSVDRDMVTTILGSRVLHVHQTTTMPDDKTDTTRFDIDLTGLASIWPQTSCASVATKPKSPWPAIPLPSASAKSSGLPVQ